ncbi:hypothetical protein WAE41_18460, partial [Pseudomonas aeruginosa]|uniref:hypothetical protein n=1 Tax=Pseudomonas aeruginosa TaxID=287 RepID=UPI00301E4854
CAELGSKTSEGTAATARPSPGISCPGQGWGLKLMTLGVNPANKTLHLMKFMMRRIPTHNPFNLRHRNFNRQFDQRQNIVSLHKAPKTHDELILHFY